MLLRTILAVDLRRLGLIGGIIAIYVVAAVISQRPTAATSERLYSLILANNKLSALYVPEALFALRHFTQGTRYVNRTRLNAPPAQGDLTLIVFDYFDDLPEHMRQNCVSFPQEETAFCDSHLLSSFPRPLPLVVNQDDPLAPQFLVLWAIGHEIGHIVLRHSRGPAHTFSLAAFMGAAKESKVSAPVPLIKLGHEARDADHQEVDADNYAIKRLELNPTRVLHIGQVLTDSILQLAQHLRDIQRVGPDDYITLPTLRNGHPHLLTRLVHLDDELRATFPLYNQYPKLFDLPLRFSIEYVSERNFRQDELFAGRRRPTIAMTPNEVSDLGLYIFFRHGVTDFARFKQTFCATPIRANADLCRDALQSKPACNDQAPEDLTCVRSTALSLLPCLSFPITQRPPTCTPDSLAQAVLLIEAQAIDQTNEWQKWTILAYSQLKAQEMAAKPDEARKFTEEHLQFLREEWGTAIALWFAGIAIDETFPQPDFDSPWMTNLSAIARDLARDLGDIRRAVHYGRLAINGWDAIPDDRALTGRAFHRTALARIYLSAATIFGMEVTEFESDYLAPARALFREALAIRSTVVTHAKEMGASEEVQTSTREQLNIAVNDMVYSLNAINQCAAASEFLDDLNRSREPIESDSTRAMNLENIAATNTCWIEGDTEIALESAAEATMLRTKAVRNDSKDKAAQEKLLRSYFTLWMAAQSAADVSMCRLAARRVAELYPIVTSRSLREAPLAYIQGKMVSLRCWKQGDAP